MQPESLQQLSEASRARVAAAASVSARINIGVLGPAASDMQLGHRTWLNLTVCTLTSRTAATKIGLGPKSLEPLPFGLLLTTGDGWPVRDSA